MTRVIHIVWGMEGGGAELLVKELSTNRQGRSLVFSLGGRRFVVEKLNNGRRVVLMPWHSKMHKVLSVLFLNVFMVCQGSKVLWHFHFPAMSRLFYRLPSHHLLTCHDLYEDELNRAALGRFEHIAAISEAVELYLKKWAPGSRVSLIPNGIPIPKGLKLPRRSDDVLRLVTVARLDIYKKGIDLVLQALKEVGAKRWKWTIVGSGKDRGALEALIHDAGLKAHVEMKGHMNHQEVWNELLSHDVFILASRYEGFGLAVVEGLYAGLNVVVPDEGGPCEIVKKIGSGKTFKSGEVVSLRNAILQSEQGQTNAQIENIRRSILAMYSIESMKAKYEQIYSG